MGINVTTIEFQCDRCHEICEREPGWSEEDMEKEYATNWDVKAKKRVVVCERCYKIIMSQRKKFGH